MREIEHLTEDCTKLQQMLDITASLRSVLTSFIVIIHIQYVFIFIYIFFLLLPVFDYMIADVHIKHWRKVSENCIKIYSDN